MKALDPLPELVELMERSARASIAYAKADTERLAAGKRFRTAADELTAAQDELQQATYRGIVSIAERLKADGTQQTGQQNSPGEQS